MMSRWCLIWTGESIPVNIPVNATKNHYASHACWLCLKNRLPLASNGSNQYHPHMFPIWLFNSSPWKIHPFLIGEPSISMGHLYHGYVRHNQRVSPLGHILAFFGKTLEGEIIGDAFRIRDPWWIPKISRFQPSSHWNQTRAQLFPELKTIKQGFPGMGVPPFLDALEGKIILKLIIWGYPPF